MEFSWSVRISLPCNQVSNLHMQDKELQAAAEPLADRALSSPTETETSTKWPGRI